MIKQNRVFVARVKPETLCEQLEKGLAWLGDDTIVPQQAHVFIKPNFTYPFYKEGVTTSPLAIEALVQVLRSRTSNITICESDGGAKAWRAEDAFAGHGVLDLIKRYGIRAMNLTEQPREVVTTEIAGHRVEVELAAPMLRECDMFITMPVPKVHVMTGVSLGFKNQWGCIPDVKRLHYHPDFPYVVLALHKLLKPKIAVFDGTYFLNCMGPMNGEPVPMNLIITSNDVGAGSLACCEIMGIDAQRIKHLRLAMREGMMPENLSQVRLNTEIQQFRDQPFELKRTWLNWITLALFHSRFLTRLFYESRLAGPAHQALYLIRGTPKDFSPQW